MKTSDQKYQRRHWWKFTDWEAVGLTAIFVVLVVFMVFSLGWIIAHPSTNDSDKTDSVADTVAVVDTVQTKSDTAVFDTVISDTRVVVKSNRPVKIVIK